MYIVYIHTKRLPDYMDFIPDENLFGFDGYDCNPEAGKRFCDSFNDCNPEQHAYLYFCK